MKREATNHSEEPSSCLLWSSRPVLHSFTPTSESLPPRSTVYRQNLPSEGPVHLHPLNPLGFLLRAAQIYPHQVALVHPDVPNPVQYTYEVWAQRVQNLAYALIHAGVKAGDRVAVIAPNCPLIADAHHGIIAARAAILPINTRLTAPEVDYILEHSGARIVLVDHEYTYLVPLSFKGRIIVSQDTGRLGCPYEAFLSSGRIYSQERGWMGLAAETNEDSMSALCYTSGTTGRPKGVVMTLRGCYLGAVANAYETKMAYESVYLWILPMFHVCGWMFPWACTFAHATQITLRTVNNASIWHHLLNSKVSHYCAAPTVQIGILNDPNAQQLPFPVSTMVGGSAPTANLISKMESMNVFPVHEYGATETYGPFTKAYSHPHWAQLPLEERARLMARQGHTMATTLELRVIYRPKEGEDLNTELKDVPRDGKTMGEVVTRGNLTMKEYFRDSEATNKATRGGWYNTGDLAVQHPDGAISILDRSKDIIISGGENSSSLAIEQELVSHPDVLEVAVVARPHPRWGERPMAFVTLHKRASKHWNGRHPEFAKELKVHARKRLPGFATPEWVHVVEELPKTSTGKIQKKELRKIVAKL